MWTEWIKTSLIALQAFLLQKQCLSFTGPLELRCSEMYMLSQMETFQTIPQAAFPGKGCLWDGRAGCTLERGTPWKYLLCSALLCSALLSSHPMPASLGLIHFPLILQTHSPALLRAPGWVETARRGFLPACQVSKKLTLSGVHQFMLTVSTKPGQHARRGVRMMVSVREDREFYPERQK